MLKIMTKEEVEAHQQKLDEWWATLDWSVKDKVRSLVWQVQQPIREDLPMQYAEDFPEPLGFYSTTATQFFTEHTQ
jgi:predicted molibdopterin-dependent oxidoreductase YjgC